MTAKVFEFNDGDEVGRIIAVDTSRVHIEIDEPENASRLSVGNLLAIKGATQVEYLIAMVERLTRGTRAGVEVVHDDGDEIGSGTHYEDHIRAVLIGTFRVVEGDDENTFKRGADTFPQISRECFLIDGQNLQRFMGLLGAGIPVESQLTLGHFINDPTAKAIACGDKLFQRHAAVLGSTGSGKSWAVALLLERAAQLRYPNIVVLDMHGEYAPLTKSGHKQFRGFRVAGPGDLSAPSSEVLFLPYWLLNREEMLSMILDRSDQNAPNQASRFTSHVRELKAERLGVEGQDSAQETFTVDSPIPYAMSSLLGRLREDDTRKGVGARSAEIKGEWEGKLTRFISRVETKLEDRRYGFMFRPPKQTDEYTWLATQVAALLGSDENCPGIKVVDFSEVPSDVLPVVVGVFARLLYSVQFWTVLTARRPFTLVCDEAHLYLPVKSDAAEVERRALEVFERIAKEGRKYGVSLLVVSQRPADVSRTILSQCNNFLALRLTNDEDQSVVRRLMPDSMAGVIDILPLLDTGEALILGDAVLLPTRIRLDKPAVRPASATRDFWKEWGATPAGQASIVDAVETLRRQTRTPCDLPAPQSEE